jgi:hypothetical protein
MSMRLLPQSRIATGITSISAELFAIFFLLSWNDLFGRG